MDGSILHISRSEIISRIWSSILIDHGVMDRINVVGSGSRIIVVSSEDSEQMSAYPFLGPDPIE